MLNKRWGDVIKIIDTNSKRKWIQFCDEILQNHHMKIFISKHLPQHLVNEMVKKGERPKLPPHFKITWLSTCIQKCWQSKVQDRPTFETIWTNLQ